MPSPPIAVIHVYARLALERAACVAILFTGIWKVRYIYA